MQKPAGAGGRCAQRALPGGGGAAEYVARNISSAPARWDARVTLRCPAEELRGRRWLRGSVEPIDEESCELRVGEDDLDWLAMKIAMLGRDFVVHEPAELVVRLGEVRDRIGRSLGG